MSDTMTLRDHSRSCGHDGAWFYEAVDYWRCDAMACPGGKEIVLRQAQGYADMVEHEGEVWLKVEVSQ